MDASPTTPSEPELGSYLRQLRQEAKISQKTLAGQVGIDVTYLSKLENGRQGASSHVLRSLADALHVPVARMLMLAGRVPDELRSAIAAEAREAAKVVSPTEAAPTRHLLTPPRCLTSFTNRVQEMNHFQQVWRHAVITITGPPGCGKSRFAAEQMCRFNDNGTAVVWLAIQQGDDSDRIRALLMAGDVGPGSVVVLDNADHALEASADVARRLVHGSSGMTVVATSRQPLGIHGEQFLRLRGLPVPDLHLRPRADGGGPVPDLEKLQTQESLSLFVDRAKLAEPGFQLDLENAPYVFDICLWFDGLPLAIELAALRLRHMTVRDLAAQLDRPQLFGELAAQLDHPHMLQLLAGNTADVPERHASLEAAIAWSFDRLTAEQRTVAVRLSRFATPFRLVDAADVAAGDELTRERVGEIVLELVDRSLLLKIEDRDQHAVYRWPKPVQQFALHDLLHGPDRVRAQERYDVLLKGFLASLRDAGSFTVADWIRLADLGPELVDLVDAMPAIERDQAYDALKGALPNLLRFGNPGSHLLSERLARSDTLGEPGIEARVRGDMAGAHRHYRAAHEDSDVPQDPRHQAGDLLERAHYAFDEARYDDAAKHLRQAGELYEQLEDRNGETEVKNLWGVLHLVRSEYRIAEGVFREALALAQRQKSRRLEAYTLHNLGLGDSLRRRIVSARIRLEQSIGIRDDIRNLRGMARVIEVFALVESETGNHAAVLRLLGAALQYRHSSQTQGMPEWWRERLERLEEEARSAFAGRPGEADRLLRLGAAMSLTEASELAVADVAAPILGPLGEPRLRSLRRAAPAGCQPLGKSARMLLEGARDDTPRPLERSIADLAQGKDVASTVRKDVREAELLALGEPDGARLDDLLCFTLDPDHHRGVIVPIFTRAAALSHLLDRNGIWESKPVLALTFDELRTSLLAGETVVINPWSPTEYRWSVQEEGYLPAGALQTST
jgi:predicted ATPase/transcriptional regulator with XRE-family HTH domain